MLGIGTRVRCNWDPRKTGTVVGYGAVCWPSAQDPNIVGDGGVMRPVYLVQVSDTSTALGPACVVWRADRVTAAGE